VSLSAAAAIAAAMVGWSSGTVIVAALPSRHIAIVINATNSRVVILFLSALAPHEEGRIEVLFAYARCKI
jgi:hypothetical protein